MSKCKAIFSSNESDREFYLGKKHDKQEDYMEEFGSFKPCIHGSDAHSYERLCKPDLDRFCWIKADPTFEGIKQILYEPEDRIAIQKLKPGHTKNIYSFSGIQFAQSKIGPNLEIMEQYIILNKDYVTVIGGKGAGKTALLDLLANNFENQIRDGNPNSFVKRIYEQCPKLLTEISFLGVDVDPFSKELCEQKYHTSSNIVYFSQGEIDKFSGDKSNLDSKILSIILSNERVVERKYKSAFESITTEVVKTAKEIEEVNKLLSTLLRETDQSIKSDLARRISAKQGEIENLNDKLEYKEPSLSAAASAEIKRLNELKDNTNRRVANIDETGQRIKELDEDLSDFLGKFNDAIAFVNKDIKISYRLEAIPAVNTDETSIAIKDRLASLSNIKSKTESEIIPINEKLEKLSGEEKEHSLNISGKKRAEKELYELMDQSRVISEKEIAIGQLIAKRYQTYTIFQSKIHSQKTLYDEIIYLFCKDKGDSLSGIAFIAKTSLITGKFISNAHDIFDGRFPYENDLNKCAELLGRIAGENDDTKREEILKSYFESIEKMINYLRRSIPKEALYDWAFGNHFGLSTDILFNGTSMDKLSMGQKGTVLLKLILAEGDCPIIIDQPEENLDNKFIFGELVQTFRTAKKKRQIIIATNNANLVVNADADQIIIASFENNEISYSSGSLEDLSIRQEITDILEGGKEAFLTREKKYGL